MKEDEFMECAVCKAKPGSPPLCAACLHNRGAIAILRYERGFLQTRLDAIRATKDELVALLDTPTIEEHVKAGGDIMNIAGRGRG